MTNKPSVSRLKTESVSNENKRMNGSSLLLYVAALQQVRIVDTACVFIVTASSSGGGLSYKTDFYQRFESFAQN